MIDSKENRIGPRRRMTAAEWDELIAVMRERRITALDANGLMTDAVLARIATLDHVTTLSLGGSRELTDDGLLHLARMPQLEYLNLSEYPGGKLTDRGLEVLRHLPNLRNFEMTWQAGITDAGVANLRSLRPAGACQPDGLAHRRWRHRSAARQAPPPQLQHRPARHRRRPAAAAQLPAAEAVARPDSGRDAAHLLIDGPFTNEGLASLAGLEGVFELDLFWHVTGITPDGFAHLVQLPNLGSLGCDGDLSDDAAMRHIAAIPRLRRLRAQESVATDDGFVALSRSQTLEFIWGRECPNFGSRGFVALSKMPALRGLGIGCKNVDDQALSTLPHFPALRELTPDRREG